MKPLEGMAGYEYIWIESGCQGKKGQSLPDQQASVPFFCVQDPDGGLTWRVLGEWSLCFLAKAAKAAGCLFPSGLCRVMKLALREASAIDSG